MEKVHTLAQFGVKAASTPAEAVRGASRVHLVLKDDAVVEEVIASARPGPYPSKPWSFRRRCVEAFTSSQRDCSRCDL